MKDENTFINFVILFSADSKIMYLTLNQKFDFYQGSNTEKMNKAKELANKMVKILLENNITIPSDMYKGSIDLRCKGKTDAVRKGPFYKLHDDERYSLVVYSADTQGNNGGIQAQKVHRR